METIKNSYQSSINHKKRPFSRKIFDILFETKDLKELRQKLEELEIKNGKVRIRDNILAREGIDYLNETLLLLKNETEFNKRIHSKITELKSNTQVFKKYSEAKEVSKEEIKRFVGDLNNRLEQYLRKSNGEIDADFIANLVMYAKDIYTDNEESLKNLDKKAVFNKLIKLKEFNFADNIDFLDKNGFIEECKQDGKIDYPKLINYIIDNGGGVSICLTFRDFEKISYEVYKEIVSKLRDKKVPVYDINTFMIAYGDGKILHDDSN